MRTSIDARANLHLIEEKYRLWQENPDSVDSGWSAFFEGFELGNLPERNGAVEAGVEAREAALQTRVDGLVYSYCSLGHTIARVDPTSISAFHQSSS
jgi:2-oxoglutarate dehydrogenase E1 component